jgi:hypothetical protein
MPGPAERNRERQVAIAYFALCELRDLGPVPEPAHFRQVRLDLHRQLVSG